jgi:hypothetical protein
MPRSEPRTVNEGLAVDSHFARQIQHSRSHVPGCNGPVSLVDTYLHVWLIEWQYKCQWTFVHLDIVCFSELVFHTSLTWNDNVGSIPTGPMES